MKKIELLKTKSFLIFFVAIAIGSIGAIGQSYLLHHELVDCYPYKIMTFPSPDFYKNIANTGVFIAPFAAIMSGLLLGRKKTWHPLIAPVVLCPVLFSLVFKTASILRVWNGILDTGRNFDGTLPNTVAQTFFEYSIGFQSSD